jgi:hypothetical protein
MTKTAFTYSLRIWGFGLIIGNLVFYLFSGGELAGLAFIFSLVGSAIPGVFLVGLIYFLLWSETTQKTAVALIMVYCVISTILPITVIFIFFGQGVEWSLFVLAIPYIIGLWVGVLSGGVIFKENVISTLHMNELLNKIGQ